MDQKLGSVSYEQQHIVLRSVGFEPGIFGLTLRLLISQIEGTSLPLHP